MSDCLRKYKDIKMDFMTLGNEETPAYADLNFDQLVEIADAEAEAEQVAAYEAEANLYLKGLSVISMAIDDTMEEMDFDEHVIAQNTATPEVARASARSLNKITASVGASAKYDGLTLSTESFGDDPLAVLTRSNEKKESFLVKLFAQLKNLLSKAIQSVKKFGLRMLTKFSNDTEVLKKISKEIKDTSKKDGEYSEAFQKELKSRFGTMLLSNNGVMDGDFLTKVISLQTNLSKTEISGNLQKTTEGVIEFIQNKSGDEAVLKKALNTLNLQPINDVTDAFMNTDTLEKWMNKGKVDDGKLVVTRCDGNLIRGVLVSVNENKIVNVTYVSDTVPDFKMKDPKKKIIDASEVKKMIESAHKLSKNIVDNQKKQFDSLKKFEEYLNDKKLTKDKETGTDAAMIERYAGSFMQKMISVAPKATMDVAVGMYKNNRNLIWLAKEHAVLYKGGKKKKKEEK